MDATSGRQNGIKNSLLRLRVENDFTETELAERLSVTAEDVIKWETGESFPDVKSIAKIAKLYNVSVGELLANPPKKEGESVVRQNNPAPEKSGGIAEKAETIAKAFNWYAFPYPIIAVMVYLLDGIIFHSWGGWLIFLTIPIYYPLIACLRSKGGFKTKAFIFPYPLVVTFLYVSFGTEFGIWSPTWLIFLTIPAYYMTIAFLPGKNN